MSGLFDIWVDASEQRPKSKCLTTVIKQAVWLSAKQRFTELDDLDAMQSAKNTGTDFVDNIAAVLVHKTPMTQGYHYH